VNSDYLQLGKTGIKISPMGLGTMQWGDINILETNNRKIDSKVSGIYKTTIDAGINFFDTAEIYGSGRSEIHLGECLAEIKGHVIVATKFMPYPWRLEKKQLRLALLNSLQRLCLNHVDLYQVHWPLPPVPIKSWMDAMADVFADGLIRAVGVSNYSPAQTKVAFEELAKHNIPLASNQVKYNLLDRRPEKSGLADLCRQLGVTIIAYSPLEKGILTGKYTPDHLPSGFRSWRYNKVFLTKITPLMDMLINIGKEHAGKTPAQGALNWLICKGAVPIPGARIQQQAIENAGGLGWELMDEEVTKLDDISQMVTM
jgi:aryl-alcohol dehydrogenase-like predicted oxidoreductase